MPSKTPPTGTDGPTPFSRSLDHAVRLASLRKAIEQAINVNPQLVIQTVLESFWPLTSVEDGVLERLHDDHDGTYQGKIGVLRAPDGDMHVYVSSRPHGSQLMPGGTSEWLRFRTSGGGGRSLRTHNALRILAEAIRLDAIEDPHAPPPK
jgi:hypothetical protein